MAMKKRSILWASILFLVLTACGSAPAQPTPPVSQEPSISVEEYKQMVSDFNDRVMEEVFILSTAGQYEYKYWEVSKNLPGGASFSSADYERIAGSAMEWVAKNSEASAKTLASAYHVLIADYAVIADANVDGEIPGDLPTYADALFGAYHQLYTAVTRPSGELEGFIAVVEDSTDAAIAFSARITHETKD